MESILGKSRNALKTYDDPKYDIFCLLLLFEDRLKTACFSGKSLNRSEYANKSSYLI